MTRFALFYQSVISDWNHGNAHFVRGLMRALQTRGHSTICYEQVDNWSLSNLLQINPHAIDDFAADFPDLQFDRYRLDGAFEDWLRARLSVADVALVHEWNSPGVIRRVGELAREAGVRAFFHDTHYRVVLDDAHRATLGLNNYSRILNIFPRSILNKQPQIRKNLGPVKSGGVRVKPYCRSM